MPLPLAHPAAVLPLRRYCPRYLSFSALIVGSIVPDTAYAFNFHHSFQNIVTGLFGIPTRDWLAAHGMRGWDGLSHTFVGGLIFCVPLGMVLMAAFFYGRTALVATLPNPHRDALMPLCTGPKHPLSVYAISLLIGAWLHVIWDSFAKQDWWLAKNWTVLQMEVADTSSAHIELYQVIWIISSIGGTVALIAAYATFLRRKGLPLWVFKRVEAPYHFLWIGAIVMPAIIATLLSLHYFGFNFSLRHLFHWFHAFYEVYATLLACCVGSIGLISFLIRSFPRQNALMN